MTNKQDNSGAYRLHLQLVRPLDVQVGRLGRFSFPVGHYVYHGSAKRGLSQRVARHQRLAAAGQGRLHWHIDYLLTQPGCRLFKTECIEGGDECELTAQTAARRGARVPVAGFGASDCRHCQSHLVWLP